jgi:hypothetical protein
MDVLCQLSQGMAHSLWSSYPYQKVLSEARLKCRAQATRGWDGGEASSRRIIDEVMAALNRLLSARSTNHRADWSSLSSGQ